jgi:hypothetical protein
MATLQAVNSHLLNNADAVKTLHAVSTALGAVAALGSAAKLIPGQVGVYAGLAVTATSILRIYVSNLETDLETPVPTASAAA